MQANRLKRETHSTSRVEPRDSKTAGVVGHAVLLMLFMLLLGVGLAGGSMGVEMLADTGRTSLSLLVAGLGGLAFMTAVAAGGTVWGLGKRGLLVLAAVVGLTAALPLRSSLTDASLAHEKDFVTAFVLGTGALLLAGISSVLWQLFKHRMAALFPGSGDGVLPQDIPSVKHMSRRQLTIFCEVAALVAFLMCVFYAMYRARTPAGLVKLAEMSVGQHVWLLILAGSAYIRWGTREPPMLWFMMSPVVNTGFLLGALVPVLGTPSGELPAYLDAAVLFVAVGLVETLLGAVILWIVAGRLKRHSLNTDQL